MEDNKVNSNNAEQGDYLLESYSIDKETFKESQQSDAYEDYSDDQMLSAEDNEVSDDDNIHQHEKYLNFIQAIKDENLEQLQEILNSSLEEEKLNFIHVKGFEGINAMEYAVLFGNTNVINYLVDLGAKLESNLEGMPLLHLSLSFAVYSHFRQKALNCFKFLLDKWPHLNYKVDRLGRTILHLVFQYDLHEAVSHMEISLEDLFAKDSNGDTVLDYACVYHSFESINSLSNKSSSCNLNLIWKETRNRNFNLISKAILYSSLNLIGILIDYSLDQKDLWMIEEIKEELSQSQTNVAQDLFKQIDSNQRSKLKSFESSKTLIIYNNNCLNHGKLTESNPIKRIKRRQLHTENPDRVNVLLQPPFGILLSDFFMQRFVLRESPKKAYLADILRCHDFLYVDKIKALCKDLATQGSDLIFKYDSDTHINSHTWDSALYACGSVIDAVDQVMTGEYSNALVLVRPPGHHAGYFGKVESPNKRCHSSNGFCFFNNVAVGAAYCKNMFRNQIKKIAIVDFDVHHGNGTEEIIRVLGKHKFSLNSENKFCDMQLTKTICSPWLDYDDPNNVLFISLHSYDENNPGAFYPSSGSTESSTGKSDPIYPGGILNVPICTETKFSYGYRNLFRTKVIPRLIRFEPDIIFVSAGFDGHENEHINIGSMKINEHDYRWITEELMKISRRFAQSRVISVLEGGYNIDAGVISSFAQSVMTHAKFLNICLNKQIENCTIMSKIKRKREYFKDLENFKKFRCEVSERTVEAYSRPLTRGTNLEIENLNKVEEVVNAPEIFTPSSLKGITKLTSVMDDPIKTPLIHDNKDYNIFSNEQNKFEHSTDQDNFLKLDKEETKLNDNYVETNNNDNNTVANNNLIQFDEYEVILDDEEASNLK